MIGLVQFFTFIYLGRRAWDVTCVGVKEQLLESLYPTKQVSGSKLDPGPHAS